MKMKKYKFLLLLVLAIILVSCGAQKPDVIVQDAAGMPIEGAFVTPISASINYNGQKTNKKGEAYIAAKAQDVKWIEVSKKGYLSSGHVPYSGVKPIVCKLKKK